MTRYIIPFDLIQEYDNGLQNELTEFMRENKYTEIHTVTEPTYFMHNDIDYRRTNCAIVTFK